MMKRHFSLFFLLVFATSQLISGCSGNQKVKNTAEPFTLKVALLPILDALPMYVAEKQGYFAAQGINVEFIAAGSAADRDQIIAAGQADGMINDLLSVLFYNKEKTQIQVVRFAQVSTDEFPLYRILVSPKSEITTAEGLKGAKIGISQGSVIEYVTDRMLETKGLASADYQTVAVPKIPDRLALLASGELTAATLPEPFASLAIKDGAKVLIDDNVHPNLGNSVISFRKEIIDQQPEAVRAFLKAIEQATSDINADPQKWQSILGDKKLVPAPLLDSFIVPTFPTASVPSQEQFADVNDWAIGRKLISTAVSYNDSVNENLIK